MAPKVDVPTISVAYKSAPGDVEGSKPGQIATTKEAQIYTLTTDQQRTPQDAEAFWSFVAKHYNGGQSITDPKEREALLKDEGLQKAHAQWTKPLQAGEGPRAITFPLNLTIPKDTFEKTATPAPKPAATADKKPIDEPMTNPKADKGANPIPPSLWKELERYTSKESLAPAREAYERFTTARAALAKDPVKNKEAIAKLDAALEPLKKALTLLPLEIDQSLARLPADTKALMDAVVEAETPPGTKASANKTPASAPEKAAGGPPKADKDIEIKIDPKDLPAFEAGLKELEDAPFGVGTDAAKAGREALKPPVTLDKVVKFREELKKVAEKARDLGASGQAAKADAAIAKLDGYISAARGDVKPEGTKADATATGQIFQSGLGFQSVWEPAGASGPVNIKVGEKEVGDSKEKWFRDAMKAVYGVTDDAKLTALIEGTPELKKAHDEFLKAKSDKGFVVSFPRKTYVKDASAKPGANDVDGTPAAVDMPPPREPKQPLPKRDEALKELGYDPNNAGFEKYVAERPNLKNESGEGIERTIVAHVLLNRREAALEAGDKEEALAITQQLVGYAKSAGTYLALAESFADLGRNDEAIAAYQQVIDAAGDDPKYAVLKQKAHDALARLTGSAAAPAVSAPKPTRPVPKRDEALEELGFEPSNAGLEEYAKANPQVQGESGERMEQHVIAHTLHNRYTAAVAAGNFDESWAIAEQLAQFRPTPNTLLLLANELWKHGQNEQALALYKQIAATPGDDPRYTDAKKDAVRIGQQLTENPGVAPPDGFAPGYERATKAAGPAAETNAPAATAGELPPLPTELSTKEGLQRLKNKEVERSQLTAPLLASLGVDVDPKDFLTTRAYVYGVQKAAGVKNPDGIWGPETHAAVQKYLKDHNGDVSAFKPACDQALKDAKAQNVVMQRDINTSIDNFVKAGREAGAINDTNEKDYREKLRGQVNKGLWDGKTVANAFKGVDNENLLGSVDPRSPAHRSVFKWADKDKSRFWKDSTSKLAFNAELKELEKKYKNDPKGFEAAAKELYYGERFTRPGSELTPAQNGQVTTLVGKSQNGAAWKGGFDDAQYKKLLEEKALALSKAGGSPESQKKALDDFARTTMYDNLDPEVQSTFNASVENIVAKGEADTTRYWGKNGTSNDPDAKAAFEQGLRDYVKDRLAAGDKMSDIEADMKIFDENPKRDPRLRKLYQDHTTPKAKQKEKEEAKYDPDLSPNAPPGYKG
ncbi:MAG: hypothetical protein IT381_04870 [Deltaproteobacteria bacterium]|nr:hypothetical protein [Deltaproteobacteria bacterium]